jgi:hypothetical protein
MQKTGKMSELQMRRFTLFFFASWCILSYARVADVAPRRWCVWGRRRSQESEDCREHIIFFIFIVVVVVRAGRSIHTRWWIHETSMSQTANMLNATMTLSPVKNLLAQFEALLPSLQFEALLLSLQIIQNSLDPEFLQWQRHRALWAQLNYPSLQIVLSTHTKACKLICNESVLDPNTVVKLECSSARYLESPRGLKRFSFYKKITLHTCHTVWCETKIASA